LSVGGSLVSPITTCPPTGCVGSGAVDDVVDGGCVVATVVVGGGIVVDGGSAVDGEHPAATKPIVKTNVNENPRPRRHGEYMG